MTDVPSQYRLLSWLSPGYPVGAFSYSHSLEYAVETGGVSDPESLVGWLTTVLLRGTGRVDGVLFREAHAAVLSSDHERLEDIAELANAFQPTSEFALESRAQGDAFIRATRSAWPSPVLDRLADKAVYPVAVAAACAAHDIAVEDGLHGYFHAFMSNLVSAAVRLIPLGQTDGQLVIAALENTVSQSVEQAKVVPLDDIGSAAPLIDLASIHHETQYTRLFRS
ncbi:MAG: urease accessory protein UreF [Alphaproteobacteria bacterium]